MICETHIKKTEIPESFILLTSLIDQDYNVKLTQNDSIYMIDCEGDKIKISKNFDDIKTYLPDKVKVIIEKKKFDQKQNKIHMDKLIKEMDDLNLIKLESNDESFYFQKFEDVDAFNKLLELFNFNKCEMTDEFKENIITKPYYSQFNDLLKNINSLMEKLSSKEKDVEKLRELNKELGKESNSKSVTDTEDMPKSVSELNNEIKKREVYILKMKNYYDEYIAYLLKQQKELNEKINFLDKIYLDSTKFSGVLKSENKKLEEAVTNYEKKIQDLEKNQHEQKQVIQSFENKQLHIDLHKDFGNKSEPKIDKLCKTIEQHEITEKNNKILIEKFQHDFISDLRNPNYSPPKDSKQDLEYISAFYNIILFKAKEEVADYVQNPRLESKVIDEYCKNFSNELAYRGDGLDLLKKQSGHFNEVDIFYERLKIIAKELIDKTNFYEFDKYFLNIYYAISDILDNIEYEEISDMFKNRVDVDNWMKMEVVDKFNYILRFLSCFIDA